MPKGSQPCDEQAHVMSGGDQDSVDGVAGRAGQVIALEQSIALSMANDRLDGIAPTLLPLDCR